MSVKVYKTVKVLTQLAGAGAGIYAMYLGAQPTTALLIIAIIVSGPEIIETMIAEQDGPED